MKAHRGVPNWVKELVLQIRSEIESYSEEDKFDNESWSSWVVDGAAYDIEHVSDEEVSQLCEYLILSTDDLLSLVEKYGAEISERNIAEEFLFSVYDRTYETMKNRLNKKG